MEKKGEDQPRLLLFLVVTVALSTLIGIVVAIVILASTNASEVVLNDQKSVDLYSTAVNQGLFAILSIRYSDPELASCNLADSYEQSVSINMRFKTLITPESCNFFVNGVLLKTERRLEPDCGKTCSFSDFNRQFSLGEFDYRDSHKIRICCNDICLDRTLEAIC